MSRPQLSFPEVPVPHDADAQSYRAKVGADAEKYVEDLHEACALAGVAEVHRVSSHLKIVKKLSNGHVVAVLVGKSVVDCMGWSCERPPRPIAVEVKHVDLSPALKSGAAAAWRFPLSKVAEHQAGMLSRLDEDGGLAVLLVVHGGQGYAVPWPIVALAKAAGATSLGSDALDPWRVIPGKPYLARLLALKQTGA